MGNRQSHSTPPTREQKQGKRVEQASAGQGKAGDSAFDGNVEAWIRKEVWRDLPEEFLAWETRFDQELQHNAEWSAKYARLKAFGCNERYIRILLFSYTHPLKSLQDLLARLRTNADKLERAAHQLSCMAKDLSELHDDLGLLESWPRLLGTEEPLPGFLHSLAYFYARTAETYRQLSDGRGSDQIFTGTFLASLAEHVARVTGQKRLALLSHLVNAAFAAHGRRGNCTEGALKDQLKKYAVRAARHGIGASFLDLFFAEKG